MADHFPPEDLADNLGTTRERVISLCVALGVPVHKGMVSKSLFCCAVEAEQIDLHALESQLAGAAA